MPRAVVGRCRGAGSRPASTRRTRTFKAPPRASPIPIGAPNWPRRFPRSTASSRTTRRRAHVPGAAWGIIIDGELAHTGVTGYRDVPSKAPVTPDTVFRIASMTKSFTAIAILKLRDEGKLSLDDPAEKYVPEMKSLVYPTSDSPRITIRHLLSHAEGFPEDNPWGDQQLADTDEQLSALISAGIPFSNAPGVAYEYSNFGFAILGRVVGERQPRIPAPTRARPRPTRSTSPSNVLKPLGMTSTTLEPSQRAGRSAGARLSLGRRAVEERAAARQRIVRLDGRHADDAVGSRASTSARSSPRGRRATVRRRRRSSDRRCARCSRCGGRRRRPVSGGSSSVQLNSGGYGYGLRISQNCQFPTIVAHGGGLPGFGTQMRWLPEYGVGLIAFGNMTYTSWPATFDAALDALARTGALQPRAIEPSPALVARARRGRGARREVGRRRGGSDRGGEPLPRPEQGSPARRHRGAARAGRRVHRGIRLRSRRERAARRLDDDLRARPPRRSRSRWRRRCRRRCSSSDGRRRVRPERASRCRQFRRVRNDRLAVSNRTNRRSPTSISARALSPTHPSRNVFAHNGCANGRRSVDRRIEDVVRGQTGRRETCRTAAPAWRSRGRRTRCRR